MVKLPPDSAMFPGRGVALKGLFYTRQGRKGPVLVRWPRRQPTPRNALEADRRKLIAVAARVTTYMTPQEQAFSRQVSAVTKLLPRDFLMLALFTRIGVFIGRDGTKRYSMAAMQDVSDLLDALGQLEGMVLYRTAQWWTALPPGLPTMVLTIGDDGLPSWVFPSGGGGAGGWKDVPLQPDAGAQWGNLSNYVAVTPDIVAPGDIWEARVIASRPSLTGLSITASPNLSHALQHHMQSDNNAVAYRYTSLGGSAINSGGIGTSAYGGSFVQTLQVQIGRSGQPHIWSMTRNGAIVGSQQTISETDFPVFGSNLLYAACGGYSGSTDYRVQTRVTHPV